MADLITLIEYKTYKKINSTSSDTAISNIIASVSALVKNYCNRSFVDFATTDKVEYFDSNTTSVLLSEFPIISVTHVKTSSDGGATQTTLVEGTDYYVDSDNDSIITTSAAPFLYSAVKFKSLEVSYKAGYTSAPDDLKIAVMDLVDYYKDEQFTSKKQTMGATIEYSPAKLPHHIKRILDLYRMAL